MFVGRAYEHIEDGVVLLVFLGILCVVNSGVRQARNRAHHHAPTPHAPPQGDTMRRILSRKNSMADPKARLTRGEP